MTNAHNLINKYKTLVSNDVETLTEEQIEEICDIECDMQDMIDTFIAEYKFYKNRIKIAETNLENIKKLIYYCMQRTNQDSFLGENGKISTSKYWNREININNVPKELLTVNYQTINSLINKGETVNGVTPIQCNISYNIR